MLKKLIDISMLPFFRTRIKFCQWLFFTIFFGTAPIIFRMIAVVCGTDVPFVVVSDFTFLGIILNASAVANVAAEKKVEDFLWYVVAFAGVSSALFVGLYMIHLNQPIPTVGIWCTVAVLLIPAFLLSLTTTDVEAIRHGQRRILVNDLWNKLSENTQQAIIKFDKNIQASKKNGTQIDVAKEFAGLLAQEPNFIKYLDTLSEKWPKDSLGDEK